MSETGLKPDAAAPPIREQEEPTCEAKFGRIPSKDCPVCNPSAKCEVCGECTTHPQLVRCPKHLQYGHGAAPAPSEAGRQGDCGEPCPAALGTCELPKSHAYAHRMGMVTWGCNSACGCTSAAVQPPPASRSALVEDEIKRALTLLEVYGFRALPCRSCARRDNTIHVHSLHTWLTDYLRLAQADAALVAEPLTALLRDYEVAAEADAEWYWVDEIKKRLSKAGA